MSDSVVALASSSTVIPPVDLGVKQGIDDARILLAYGAESGRELDEKAIRTVIEAARLVGAGSLTADHEIAFWAAYRHIATAAAPATVASLRATLGDSIRPHASHDVSRSASSPAGRTARYYTGWAILVLLLLLTVQVFQLFGATVTREIESLSKEYDALIAKRQVASSKSPPPQLELNDIDVDFENLRLRQSAAYALLTWWSNRLPGWVAPVSPPIAASDDAQLADRLAIQQRALMINEALQRYLLPLLYGLLGSCVYVLRALARHIQARSYTEAMNIGFRLRIHTGALSGLVVGWFFSGEGSSTITTLQPNALAFLAGYSVDLLFSAMDRILGAFSPSASNAEHGSGQGK